MRKAFAWRGHHFAQGTWVLLDLCGTNHDPRTWQEPETFRPERFRGWGRSAFNFIPQAGAITTMVTVAPANGSRSS